MREERLSLCAIGDAFLRETNSCWLSVQHKACPLPKLQGFCRLEFSLWNIFLWLDIVKLAVLNPCWTFGRR